MVGTAFVCVREDVEGALFEEVDHVLEANGIQVKEILTLDPDATCYDS